MNIPHSGKLYRIFRETKSILPPPCPLFFDKHDTISFLDAPSLMQAARDMLSDSYLIGGCALGLQPYVRAFFRGFWPFVQHLEQIVDERSLAREPLNMAAGSKHEATKKLIKIARAREQLVSQEVQSLGWMRGRKASHAEYWRADAKKRNVDLFGVTPTGVQQLINMFKTAETLADFFGCLVAGEMVAIGLGEYLGHSDPFNYHGRSLWIDAHLVESEVSALDINMSFMRAYAITAPDDLRRMVLQVISMFGAAAYSVFDEILE